MAATLLSAGSRLSRFLRDPNQQHMPSFRTLAKLLVAAALLAAHWYIDDARPFHYWTRCADLALGSVFAAYLVVVIRGRLRDAMIVVASVLFCLAAAEAYAMVSLSTGPTTHIVTPGHLVHHPFLGWGLGHPGVFHDTMLDRKTGRVIFDIDYTIDQHRNRQVVSVAEGPTVAFFGDSFTFGDGLPDAETFPQAFADLTGRRFHVLNLGVSGYGPQQFLRALETGLFDDLLVKPRLFVFQTAPWHADRSGCIWEFAMAGPRYTMVDGQPTFRGACRDRWSPLLGRLFTMQMYRVYLQPVLLGGRPAGLELYIAVLVRAGELAREKYGVPTIILYLPDDGYLRGSGYTDQQIMQRLRDGGLIVIDGGLDQGAFPNQPLIIPGDGHPTGLANRVRAALVRDRLGDVAAHSP